MNIAIASTTISAAPSTGDVVFDVALAAGGVLFFVLAFLSYRKGFRAAELLEAEDPVKNAKAIGDTNFNGVSLIIILICSAIITLYGVGATLANVMLLS